MGGSKYKPTGNQTNIPNLVYNSSSNSFTDIGTTQNYSVASTQVGTTSNTPGSAIFTMVVPKTDATVTNLNVTMFGNDFASDTVWNIRVNCPCATVKF